MSRIVAMGGGGPGPEHRPMHRYILSLAEAERPKICFVATGKGDRPETLGALHGAFGALPCETSHLALFDRKVRDLRAFVLAQDILLVWGGNTASLLAVWRAHGLDEILREAATRGVVLAGACAGALAWFEDGVTDSFGGLDRLGDGLGLLPGSLCPYYDADPQRRPTYHRLVAAGELAPGVAVDVGAALRYEDGELAEVVSRDPDAHAWRVRVEDGGVREEVMVGRLLG